MFSWLFLRESTGDMLNNNPVICSDLLLTSYFTEKGKLIQLSTNRLILYIRVFSPRHTTNLCWFEDNYANCTVGKWKIMIQFSVERQPCLFHCLVHWSYIFFPNMYKYSLPNRVMGVTANKTSFFNGHL